LPSGLCHHRSAAETGWTELVPFLCLWHLSIRPNAWMILWRSPTRLYHQTIVSWSGK
jgi:hypothetical protein